VTFPLTLRQYDKLVLIDSTHKSNKLQWCLYTFMVRDTAITFIPCAHLLPDGEDANILTAAMRTIKKWCNHGQRESSRWVPRWFLTDEPAAEQLAVQMAAQEAVKWAMELAYRIEVRKLEQSKMIIQDMVLGLSVR
jgi:hypothetical protein